MVRHAGAPPPPLRVPRGGAPGCVCAPAPASGPEGRSSGPRSSAEPRGCYRGRLPGLLVRGRAAPAQPAWSPGQGSLPR